MPSAVKKFKGLKGEYLLLAPLGQGSSSEIQLAKQLEVEGAERFLLYKQLKSRLASNEGQAKRFIREARIASLFDHPSLPRTAETGKIKDTYFVMKEFLLGDSLGFLLSQAGEAGQLVTPRVAACLATQVLDALAYLHELQSSKGEGMNLLHRNVNLKTLVLLPSGRVKLTHMNLRRKEDLPHPTSCLGHQSPELSAGLPAGPATDVFSMGMVLWETLTGRHLFVKDSKLDTRMAVTECRVPRPRELRSGVPEDLEQVVIRALQKEAGDRYPSAGEMGKALRAFLGDPNELALLEEVRQFGERVAHDRFRAKAGLLEDIEAGRAEEVDAKLLLPGLDYTLLQADQEAAEEETSPEIKPAGGAAPPAGEQAPQEAQPQARPQAKLEDSRQAPEEMEETTSPHIGQPASRGLGDTLDIWFRMLRERDWRAIAGTSAAVVVLMLMIGLILAPGEEPLEDQGTGEDDRQAAHIEADGQADAVPEAMPEAVLETGPETEPQEIVEEPAAPRETGRPVLARLEVTSDPAGCPVKLAGLELSGRTPLKNVLLPAGVEYAVEVACPGYEVERRMVIAQAGQMVPMEFYPPRQGNRGNSYGRLQLFTKPKVVVYLGKRRLGTTPLKGVRLPAGTHQLRLVNSRRKIDKQLEVAIQPGTTTRLRPQL